MTIDASQLAKEITRIIPPSPDEWCLLGVRHWSMCMTKAEWSGWMQAIGSILALVIAIGFPIYQGWRNEKNNRIVKKARATVVAAKLFVILAPIYLWLFRVQFPGDPNIEDWKQHLANLKRLPVISSQDLDCLIEWNVECAQPLARLIGRLHLCETSLVDILDSVGKDELKFLSATSLLNSSCQTGQKEIRTSREILRTLLPKEKKVV